MPVIIMIIVTIDFLLVRANHNTKSALYRVSKRSKDNQTMFLISRVN